MTNILFKNRNQKQREERGSFVAVTSSDLSKWVARKRRVSNLFAALPRPATGDRRWNVPAEIKARRQERRSGGLPVPGGGWARSTLQEVGRRNWIPARSKRQQLERTEAGIGLTAAHTQETVPTIWALTVNTISLSSYRVKQLQAWRERNTDLQKPAVSKKGHIFGFLTFLFHQLLNPDCIHHI